MSKHLEYVKTKTFGVFKWFFFLRMKQFNKFSTNPQSILVKRGLHLLTCAMCRQELLLWCHEHIPGTPGVTTASMLSTGLHTWLTSFLAVFFQTSHNLWSPLLFTVTKFFVTGNLTFLLLRWVISLYLSYPVGTSPLHPPSLLGRGQLQPCHHVISSSTCKTSVTAKKPERFGKMPARLSAGRGGEESPVTTRWLSLANLAFSSRMTFFSTFLFFAFRFQP